MENMIRIGHDKFLIEGENWSFRTADYPEADFYCTHNGRKLGIDDGLPPGNIIQITPKLLGGKGGFGSMLRAIGAQIEKTTNREACRDLSGRRLRDINEEKRLKNWINNKAELEKEQKEKRRKKLERMVQEPKVEFKDSNYESARTDMTEKVADALEQGLKATASTSGVKRPCEETTDPKKKKKKIWGMDDELSDSSENESDNEVECVKKSTDDKLKEATVDAETTVNDNSAKIPSVSSASK